MRRKRHQVAQNFRLPDPFNPVTGEYAPLCEKELDGWYWGVLDEVLPFNSTDGVAFSIWRLNSDKEWVDTDTNLNRVYPPFLLKHALIPPDVRIKVERKHNRNYVALLPYHFQGELTEALAPEGTADVLVGEDTFEDCKALDSLGESIASGAKVQITLYADGYYYVDSGGGAGGGIIIGYLAGTLAAGGTANMNRYINGTLSTTEIVVIHDWLMPSGATLPEDTKVAAMFLDGCYFIIGAWIPSEILVDHKIDGYLFVNLYQRFLGWPTHDPGVSTEAPTGTWETIHEGTDCSEGA